MAAAQRAESLLPAGTHYTVLAVVRPPIFVAGPEIGVAAAPSLDPGNFAEAQQTADAEGDAAANTTAALLAEAASERVVHGDPGTVICRIAEDEAFDLIVVGSHGSGFIKRVLLGSVSHHVLHHAPCPVLVVREGAPEG